MLIYVVLSTTVVILMLGKNKNGKKHVTVTTVGSNNH